MAPQSDIDTINVSITPVNDAPTSGARRRPGHRRGRRKGDHPGMSVADIDGSNLTGVTLSVTNGTLTLASVAGAGLHVRRRHGGR